MQDYSLLHPQTARFTTIPADVVYACLQADERPYCIEGTQQRAFWIYLGDPAFDTPAYGTVCFGDLELRGDGTLFASGLSDAPMEVLLDLLRQLKPGASKMQRDPFLRLEKSERKRQAGNADSSKHGVQ